MMKGQQSWSPTSKRNTRSIFSETALVYLEEMLEKPEALQILKEVLNEAHRPDADFIIELSAKGLFWVIRPGSYDDYGVGLGHWMIHRETDKVEAINPHIDPNVWEEMYHDDLEPTQVWIIRLDPSEKKSMIKLKNLLKIPLNEVKSLTESPHWFGGHRTQLESIQKLLCEKGIVTLVERVTYTKHIKKIKAFPHVLIFMEDVTQLIRHEDSHWWKDEDEG